MFILRIILIFIGFVFIGFGYAIWFKEKYNLINNYQNDKKNGKLDEAYAKRVGKIEFLGGIACVVFGIITMFLNDTFTLLSFIICIVIIIATLILNQVRSTK